ncbi:MAG: hypothetical protein N2C14_27200 [Planctomycetales bacterium]
MTRLDAIRGVCWGTTLFALVAWVGPLAAQPRAVSIQATPPVPARLPGLPMLARKPSAERPAETSPFAQHPQPSPPRIAASPQPLAPGISWGSAPATPQAAPNYPTTNHPTTNHPTTNHPTTNARNDSQARMVQPARSSIPSVLKASFAPPVSQPPRRPPPSSLGAGSSLDGASSLGAGLLSPQVRSAPLETSREEWSPPVVDLSPSQLDSHANRKQEERDFLFPGYGYSSAQQVSLEQGEQLPPSESEEVVAWPFPPEQVRSVQIIEHPPGYDSPFIEPGLPARDAKSVYPWRFTADVMFLHRSKAGSRTLVRNPNNLPVLNVSSLDMDFEAGMRLSGIHQWGCDVDLEFAFLGFHSWDAFADFTQPGLQVRAPDQSVFILPDAAYAYDSSWNTAEFNARWRQTNWFTWLAGVRYLELKEEFIATSSGFPGGLFSIESYNHLIGAQCGAHAIIVDHGGPFTLRTTFKLGAYGNRVGQRTAFPAGTTNGSTVSGEFAWLLDYNLTAVYEHSDRVDFRLGYNVFWLEGVALAPEQVLSQALDMDGSLFLHGLNLGASIRW